MIPEYNIYEVKNNLSKIINRLAEVGGEVRICRSGKPVATLTLFTPEKRQLGGYSLARLPRDFNDDLEITRLMLGGLDEQ